MNIKITYKWLLEYLDTEATPYELQKYLSLCGPGVERIEKFEADDDYSLDIEITSNRIDMASVFGIAQEAQAILPRFGIKARLKLNPFKTYTFDNLKAEPHDRKPLDVKTDTKLNKRFTAMVFSDVQIKPAPEVIKRRLEMCDIKSINNVVDISNYIMLALGQPIHMFDYDQIRDAKMTLRESKKGEKLVTLDNKEVILPGGDIVIEDGDGRLIDLCGIMGGANSAISADTETIVFFAQHYDKRHIRHTSMVTGQRTVAATYFEKDLDPERVETAFVYGVDLINALTGGIADSELIDIYPQKTEIKTINVTLQDVQKLMGIEISHEDVKTILEDLGFTVAAKADSYKITVPSYRAADIEIKQDIIEEVARVYGYFNLPNSIVPMVYIKQPHDVEVLFTMQNKAKTFLKHLGLHEVMNYSMISADLIDSLGWSKEKHLKLANTISTEIEYMRLSLLPSLIKNIQDNQGRREKLSFFEISKVYPKTTELPDEQYKLSIAMNSDFFELKGVIEALLQELNLTDITFEKKHVSKLFSPQLQAGIIDAKGNQIGLMGSLSLPLMQKLGLKGQVSAVELDFHYLAEHSRVVTKYQQPAQFAVIKLDATIKPGERTYAEITEAAMKKSKLLENIEMISQYEDSLTLRFYFSSSERNITEKEAKEELEKLL
ncbi:MAG: phenylalanine--tRNA ligase subunit beta [Weeksellaceae bacterium]